MVHSITLQTKTANLQLTVKIILFERTLKDLIHTAFTSATQVGYKCSKSILTDESSFLFVAFNASHISCTKISTTLLKRINRNLSLI